MAVVRVQRYDSAPPLHSSPVGETGAIPSPMGVRVDLYGDACCARGVYGQPIEIRGKYNEGFARASV